MLSVQCTIASCDRVATKRFAIDAGHIVKLGAPPMTYARIERVTIELARLGAYLDNLQSNQTLIPGLPINDGATRITTRAKYDRMNDRARAITTTREKVSFRYPEPGLITIDIDHGADFGVDVTSPERVRNVLITLDPALAAAAMLVRPSASAGVHRAGDPGPVIDSWHVYMVGRGGSIEACTRRLADRCIDLGWSRATEHGRTATLIDRAVSTPERVDYAARAVLAPGIVRHAESCFFAGGMVEIEDVMMPVVEHVAHSPRVSARADDRIIERAHPVIDDRRLITSGRNRALFDFSIDLVRSIESDDDVMRLATEYLDRHIQHGASERRGMLRTIRSALRYRDPGDVYYPHIQPGAKSLIQYIEYIESLASIDFSDHRKQKKAARESGEST